LGFGKWSCWILLLDPRFLEDSNPLLVELPGQAQEDK